MQKKPAVNCEYFSEGKCTGVGVELRASECRNNLKDACCYTCHLRRDCEISCDFLEARQKVVQVAGEVKMLSSEQVTDISHLVALDVYWISGLVFITLSLLIIFCCSIDPYFDYFGNIRMGFLLLERAPPDVKSRLIGELFLLLSPFLLMILGFSLAAYSRIKKMQKHARVSEDEDK